MYRFPSFAARPTRSLATRATGYAPYPGAPLSRLTSRLTPTKPELSPETVIPTFQVITEQQPSNVSVEQKSQTRDMFFKHSEKKHALRILRAMMRLRALDTLCLQAHRQGRVPFYAPSLGEEAAIIGSAAALNITDEVFSQYREHGLLLYRMAEARYAQSKHQEDCDKDPAEGNLDRTPDFLPFMRQNCGSVHDIGRARQMSMHYGDTALCFQMVSSTVAAQVPHAAGAAYALKRAGKSQERIAVTFFGDGGSSEGDFHAGLNIAATTESPVLFLCRNNGFAISTPVQEQMRCDGVAGRAAGGYGVTSYRVDGNDALAVYRAVSHAREFIIRNQKPALVELMTYRQGDHSTSDDSSMYRDVPSQENIPDPITRFARYLELQHRWWVEETSNVYLSEQRRYVLKALEIAEKEPKPEALDVFQDVYAGEDPQALQRQRAELSELLHQGI